jgi:CRP/FNR family transcriptional regulator/CRP/FNR family cyclic AMP-dependent transcriptional regulator
LSLVNNTVAVRGNNSTMLLAQVPFFASLGERDLRALAETCRGRSFEPGEVLFEEGEEGSALYLLRAGQVKIVREAPQGESVILHIYGPGECLGEMALVDGQPRSATAVALEHVEALLLYREEFLALLERRPAVARAVMSALVGLVRRLNEQLQDAIFLDVPARMAKKLLELADEHGQPTPQGIRLTLRLTQGELAQMVGAARPTVNKQLQCFQKRGSLTVDLDGITLLRPEELQKRIY